MSVTTDLPDAPHETETNKPGRLRLDFLEGLRGLAALYVAQYHIVQDYPQGNFIFAFLCKFLAYGHFAVAIFIVLSGYCLMLPVARSADGALRGGSIAYLKRRAWRIIPPYYIALALTLLLLAATQIILHTSPPAGSYTPWDIFAPTNLFLHITLLHNLSPRWMATIDPPMWSVALEWQIYFLLPLLILPFWKRIGGVCTMIFLVILSSAPHFLLPAGHNLDYVLPWYIGLFAMGVSGAAIGFSDRPLDRGWRNRLPWGKVSLSLGTIFILYTARLGEAGRLGDSGNYIVSDLLIGLALMSFIIYCARSVGEPTAAASPILRLLSSRPALTLGRFSYSLYLIHAPASWILRPLYRGFHLKGLALFVFEMGISVPWAIGVSYLFFLAFERHFLSFPTFSKRERLR